MKKNQVPKSNISVMLQKLNAAAVRLGLPTLKLSPQQLMQQVQSLKNLAPELQKQKLKDILVLMRYEKPIINTNHQKVLLKSSPFKMLQTVNKVFDLKDKKVSNLVRNIQKLVLNSYKEITKIDNLKQHKINYYNLLDVSPSVNHEAITAARDEKLKQANEKQREQINEAYQVLSNDEERLEYDVFLTQSVDEVDDFNDDEKMIAEVLVLNQFKPHELTPEEKAQKQQEFAEMLQAVTSILIPDDAFNNMFSEAISLKPSSEKTALSPADMELLAISKAVESMRSQNQGLSFGLGLLETTVDLCRSSETAYSMVKFFGGY